MVEQPRAIDGNSVQVKTNIGMESTVSNTLQDRSESIDFEIRPLCPALGMEVSGIDLTRALNSEQVRVLRRALVDRSVLCFRDQNLSPDQQVKFASSFGHVPQVPDSMFLVHPDNPHVSVLENDANRAPTVNNWHSDYSFAAEPDFASVLQANIIPQIGGDTVWSSMFAAYDGLSDGMKTRLEGLTAAHDYMKLYERPAKKAAWAGERGKLMQASRQKFPPVYHPVVREHPESGRKALFVNESFTRHIDDLSVNESHILLEHLFAQARVPEYQLRLSWNPGDLVIWDNRSTVHYALADYYPQHRRMHRVTVLEHPREVIPDNMGINFRQI